MGAAALPCRLNPNVAPVGTTNPLGGHVLVTLPKELAVAGIGKRLFIACMGLVMVGAPVRTNLPLTRSVTAAEGAVVVT